MPDTLKLRFKNLALGKKVILIGSALLVVSTFLPWYSDIDRFKTGDTFLGVSGPLYLAGLLVLVSGVLSFGLVLLTLLEKPQPKLPMKENYVHIAGSALCLLMLVLSASVYFHSKFGVNLTDKSVGFGMIMAFVTSGFVMAGGLMSLRTTTVDFDMEGHLEPLITVGQDRQQADLNREVTVEDAMNQFEDDQEPVQASAYIKDSRGWGPVQESMNSIQNERRGEQSGSADGGFFNSNTNDIR